MVSSRVAIGSLTQPENAGGAGQNGMMECPHCGVCLNNCAGGIGMGTCCRPQGSGHATYRERVAPGFFEPVQKQLTSFFLPLRRNEINELLIRCHVCSGTGRAVRQACPKCHGTGVLHKHNELITIPVKQGAKRLVCLSSLSGY